MAGAGALTQDRKTDPAGVFSAIPELLSFIVEATTTIYAGAMVGTDTNGYAVPMSANNTLVAWGRCEKQVLSAAGSAGTEGSVNVRPGYYFLNIGTGADAITRANIGALCYAADDNSACLTSAGGTRPVLGTIVGMGADMADQSSSQVLVAVGPVAGNLAFPDESAIAPILALFLGPHVVRNACFTNQSLTAYVGVTGGTPNDGVTNVAGDRILLLGQTTASQNGIYVVGTVATGTAPLTRPADWPTGSNLPGATTVSVSEGVAGAATQWIVTTKAPITIDTTSVAFGYLDAGVGNKRARMVCTANVSLAAFVGVTGGSSTNTDGVLAVAGDIVLLTAQTTASQNGPYVVGPVATGTAALSRPSWFYTGSAQPAGALALEVGGEGTIFKNTRWKSFYSAANSYVVDTTDGLFYPLEVNWSAPLVSGVGTAGASHSTGSPAVMAVFSANSQLFLTRAAVGGTVASTVMYAQDPGTVVAGPCGTGAIAGFAVIAPGTLNTADTSTVNFKLVNQL